MASAEWFEPSPGVRAAIAEAVAAAAVGPVDLSGYLTSATAASTYLAQADAATQYQPAGAVFDGGTDF